MSQIFIGKLIEEELRSQDRSVVWFANKLSCNRTNVYKIFHRASIDTELLLRISNVLKRNFFDVYTIAFRSDSHAVLTHRRLHFPHRRNVTPILSSITPEKLDTGAIAKLPPPPARASMTLPTLHPLSP